MAFLSDAEIDALRIERMILHVVGKKDALFEAQRELPLQETEFFKARIIDEASSGVHSFLEHSFVKPILEEISTEVISFEAGAQRLSQTFFTMHVKSSTSGAFFVFQLATSEADVKIFALLKYDYREAVELTHVEGRHVLRAIVQAFIKDRRALQKYCIARVRGGVAEPLVSASDRMEEAPDLTDYFERYLGVQRSRSTQELSGRLREAIRGTLDELKDRIPDGHVGRAVARAKIALQGRATVTNEDVFDAILHSIGRPDDEDVRAKIERVIRRKLKAKGLDNVAFRPDPQTLQVQPRNIVRTFEGVVLEFPGEELNRSVVREELPGGGATFTITTDRPLVEDGTKPQKIDADARRLG